MRQKSRKGSDVMKLEEEEIIKRLLNGAYDLHMHTAPSPFGRKMDEFALLRAADKAGMDGILLKSHYESTAARAQLVNQYAGARARAYGAIVLNCPVGGLNPYAVSNALKRGCRIVFMPTRDAANSLVSGDMPGDFFKRAGISALDENGGLLPEVFEIMELVRQNDAALATGHLSPEESVILCREGRRRGVRMVLTHPEFSRTKIDADIQRELADMGVLIEKCWYNVAEGECLAARMAENIRIVGAERCFMTTDRGQGNREAPVEGMRRFLAAMLHEGLSEEEVFVMTHDVPRRVLGV